jgi:hypothetical protein
MTLVADQGTAKAPKLARMTFSQLPGGQVRQFGEQSVDGGKTWATSFDLVYTRRK